MAPIDDLFISLPTILCAEWRPPDQAFEHDSTHTPPVTAERIALPTKNLRGDVIWSTDGRVSHNTAGFPPVIDLASIAYSEVNLVESDGMAVVLWSRRAFQELLIVGIFVLGVEACAQAEVCELYVTFRVKKDVIRLDISIEKIRMLASSVASLTKNVKAHV